MSKKPLTPDWFVHLNFYFWSYNNNQNPPTHTLFHLTGKKITLQLAKSLSDSSRKTCDKCYRPSNLIIHKT